MKRSAASPAAIAGRGHVKTGLLLSALIWLTCQKPRAMAADKSSTRLLFFKGAWERGPYQWLPVNTCSLRRGVFRTRRREGTRSEERSREVEQEERGEGKRAKRKMVPAWDR